MTSQTIEVTDPAFFKTSVKACARCGQDHDSVQFVPFTNPTDDVTHYGTCPVRYQPILCMARAATDDRTKELRASVRGSLIYYLEEDLDNNEYLMKEVFEQCETDADFKTVYAEMKAIIKLLEERK